MAVHVVRTQGVLALYNGLSASLTRQVIWWLLNKGMPHYIYRVFKNFMKKGATLITKCVISIKYEKLQVITKRHNLYYKMHKVLQNS